MTEPTDPEGDNTIMPEPPHTEPEPVSDPVDRDVFISPEPEPHPEEPGEPPPPEDDLDFDLAALRAAPQNLLHVEEAVLNIAHRKPKTDEWFRTREGFVQDLPLLQVEVHDRKDQFWVVPGFRAAIADRLTWFRTFACVNRAGTPFLWPISLSDAPVAKRWRDTALVIANEALTTWVTKIVAEGAYKVGRAKGDLGEPRWPDMAYEEWVKVAFKSDDHTVRDANHFVIRHITGEA